MTQESKYSKRGVSAQKEDVHSATRSLDKGVFPGAFCQAVPSFSTPEDLFLLHADGAGTKSSLAYIYWKETGDATIFRGIAIDALIMNIDDLLCAGVTENFLVSSTIGRNKNRIPGELLKQIIESTQENIEMLNSYGAKIKFCGGETADVGDLVRTIIVDSTVMAQIPRSQFINAADIQPNKVIVGLSSFGKTSYEKSYNAGMGSNGLTSARHELLSHEYATKYPESYDDTTDLSYVYTGKYKLTDPLEGTPLNIGQAILSPTRTYLPLIREILPPYKSKIDAIIHCSGGAQTKCLKFSKNIHFIKNNLFPFPPLFQKLAETTSAKEMFEVFNCGHRLEIYTDLKTAEEIIKVSAQFQIDAKIIGITEDAESNHLTLTHNNETFHYTP